MLTFPRAGANLLGWTRASHRVKPGHHQLGEKNVEKINNHTLSN